ncbi:MAG: T9SS type A sorting domain-containing protein [Ignavibacteria bacterium]|nr:T9SS type A sorting domain-containing protein [Ignavibacteria bacterium]MBK7185151.1 T9SS type A sorting domain-containing protein [Ignavibacteria bacterium]MBK7413116.1 T9SS type A sorting domain-containing protein [Ignavibacteria bacterium]
MIRTLLILVFASVVAVSQVVTPALPNTDSVVTCFPDTTGYARLTVGSNGRMFTDLQSAIDAAQLGTVIVVDADQVTEGTIVLRKKDVGSGWIIIMPSTINALPNQGLRISPTMASVMPRFVTTNTAGHPAVRTESGAHHYRLIGIEITADEKVQESYGLVFLGDNGPAQTTLEEVPHHLIIDRCYIHGHTNGTVMKFGVRLDCANAAIIDSYISDFHSIGFDAQAIAGVNGPGPFKIINNYLEASGENIMFGGGAPSIPNLVPSDIEIRQNHMYKPLTWRVSDATYAGKHWTIKNLFELKTGRRVLLDGNTLENSWADLPIGQSGYAILLTVRAEGGKAPQADVSDVTITNNIVRNVGAGITISGSDDIPSTRSSRILIANNLFTNINGPAFGDGNVSGPNDGTFLKIGNPENVSVVGNTIEQTGPITWAFKPTSGFVFTKNVANCFRSAGGYQGIYGPGKAEGDGTIQHYFPDITDANRRFSDNVLIGGNASRYTEFGPMSKNVFPTSAVGVDPSLGLQRDVLDSAFARKIVCEATTSTVEHASATPHTWIQPQPASDHLLITTVYYGNSTYHLVDATGRTVLQGEFVASPALINISSLATGTYVIRMISGSTIETRTLSILR